MGSASGANRREEFVLRYLPLVRRIARAARRVVPEAEVDELISVGTIGLIEAIDRYDPRRGVPLASFAYPRIKGAIIDEGRRQAVTRLGTNLVSLHQGVGDAGVEADLELVDASTDPTSPAPSVHVELSELLSAIRRLPPRERGIIALHVKGFTVAEIAGLEGCSPSRASQLLTQAHVRLEEATAA
jgi:RNA polymerase sigma factor (sigma-70 family)